MNGLKHLRKPELLTLLALAAMFWGTRILYWLQISEAPFSDLLDYVNVARNIYTHFFWGENPSLSTYYAPTTPAFIALSLVIGGEAGFEWVFRFLIQCLAFASLLLLCIEIFLLTRNQHHAYALLIVVALCRPSIFWSYKLGTETVSEALLWLTMAAGLRAIRTKGWQAAMFAGSAGLALGLGRPQFLPAVLLMGLTIVLCASFNGRIASPRIAGLLPRTALRQGFAFAVGVLIVWSPWLVRNHRITHNIVAVGTSGTDSLLWEAGGGPIGRQTYTSLALSDGTVITEFGLPALRQWVAHLPTDYERKQRLQLVVDAWLRANWKEFPELVTKRLLLFASQRGPSALTTVSRERLFGEADRPAWARMTRALNVILFDKSTATSWIALAGAAIAALTLGGAGWVLATMAIVPAIVAACVIGIERSVEPLIPLQLWLAFFAMATAFAWLRRRIETKRRHGARLR
ncbi:hypothetical protein E0H22_09250 [Rhodopseudomonas boonkerdii]|uniref:hypothetical protein n=1 Tax=Rhodopseudomonas boonkerdii TaxID=475937 RepID=UPI001E36FE05|nr:hypothetical protein [Rhodopseudomonas boonkerdii]UGV25856.1 hypothetical protein E0H22_09250 [Rhodopseudomonas boonkerdii]